MAAVIVGEEDNKASSVISNNVGAAKHMQLCLLDAQGNKTNISSIEQFQTAITLLDDLKQTYDTHTDNHHTEDDALSEQTTILDEVKRFELFRTVIQHEDDLLNQRVSWIILAQSFLMAAFITNAESQDSLKYITAIVGMLTVVVTMPAILAAGRNIEMQQQIYFAQISSEERCRELHGHGRNILQHSSQTSDKRRKLIEEQIDRLTNGHVLPNMAFRGRGSIPIVYTVISLAAVQFIGWIFLLVALIKGW